MFSINQPLFLQKKLSLYIQIPNIYLGLGLGLGLGFEFEFEFEYGPQIIRDLAIVCPLSVTMGSKNFRAYLQ